MLLAILGQYTVPLAQRNILSRPIWELCSPLLIDDLRAWGITTAFYKNSIHNT